MGGIISRPVGYVKRKVEDTKAAVRRKVDNTKNAIYTKYDNTKCAIYNKYDNTRNAIYTKIDNTKNAITNRVTRVKNGIADGIYAASDGVYTRVNNSYTAVCNKVTATKNAVIAGKNKVVSSVVAVKDGIVTRYVNTKTAIYNFKNRVVCRCRECRNAVVQKYRQTKEKIYTQYRRVRNAKLTRRQKFKYGLLFHIVLMLTFIIGGMLGDAYRGDYDMIDKKVDRLWYLTCKVGNHTADAVQITYEYTSYVTILIAQYTYKGIVHLTVYTWKGICIATHYSWEGIKIASFYTYTALRIAMEYIYHGLTIAAAQLWDWCKICAAFIWEWLSIAGEYIAIGSRISWDYTVHGTKVAGNYTAYGIKTGATYTAQGTKYALYHGSIALKDFSIKLLKLTFYLLTNFRQASYEGAVWAWEMSWYLGECSIYGAKEGSIMAWDGTKYLANLSNEGFWGGVYYSGVAAQMTFEGVKQGAIATGNGLVATFFYIINGFKVGTLNLIELSYRSVFFIYYSIISIATGTYYGAYTLITTLYTWTVDTYTFITEWSRYIYTTVGTALHVALNEYLLKWLYIVASYLYKWAYGLGSLLYIFFKELAINVYNVVYTVVYNVYSVLYVVFSFVFQIISTFERAARSGSRGLKTITTSIFKVVVWLLEETLFAYMFMLQKYNMYREILFGGFLVVISLYCTGLMRDRRETGADDEESSDEEDDIDFPSFEEIFGEAPPKIALVKPDGKEEPPPAYDAPHIKVAHKGKSQSAVVKQEPKATLEVTEDSLGFAFESDVDSDFGLDQVPDFMDTSGSEIDLPLDEGPHHTEDEEDPHFDPPSPDSLDEVDIVRDEEGDVDISAVIKAETDLQRSREEDLDGYEAEDSEDEEELTRSLSERVNQIKMNKSASSADGEEGPS